MIKRVVIYESSSFGGNYKYSLELASAYKANSTIDDVLLVLPVNSAFSSTYTKKSLFSDKSQGGVAYKKVSFLLRTFLNPICFLFLLLRQKSSLVVFNDFEQISAFFWVPLFKIFASKHKFAIVLHDPDRDAYPPNKFISSLSMRCLLWLCRIALYHEHLPSKGYYKSKKVQFVSVPHGLYPSAEIDEIWYKELVQLKRDKKLLATLGNVRFEKNYEQVIRSLSNLPNCLYLIAGKPANSAVDVEKLRLLANQLGVEERIIWKFDYLTEAQLAACIAATDVCLLNYLPSFTSQSGLINLYAPFKKRVVISDIESGLSSLNKKFGFGIGCDPLRIDTCVFAVEKALSQSFEKQWDEYIDFASWDNHVSIVLKHCKG